MDWSRFTLDWGAAYRQSLELLSRLFTDPSAPFWWPTLVAALLGATVLTAAARSKSRGFSSSALKPFAKELPVDVLCLLGYIYTQALMAPLLLLATIAGTTAVILTAGMPSTPASEAGFWAGLAVAALVFVCSDFMLYWSHRLFHWLKPLWLLHRLHHQPEVLTPITAFRFWPPETAVHFAAFALGEGIALGIAAEFLGTSLSPLKFAGINVFLAAWYLAFSHLRHSHVALYFPRWLSYVVLSPHMHQAHHSADPGLHNRNFGSGLGVWDWLFGTLHIPAREERFRFGVATFEGDPVSLTMEMKR
jgi:sterol desaturase/sphingolipid hydroxylase (fatty acid hydroxylase superfamily)